MPWLKLEWRRREQSFVTFQEKWTEVESYQREACEVSITESFVSWLFFHSFFLSFVRQEGLLSEGGNTRVRALHSLFFSRVCLSFFWFFVIRRSSPFLASFQLLFSHPFFFDSRLCHSIYRRFSSSLLSFCFFELLPRNWIFSASLCVFCSSLLSASGRIWSISRHDTTTTTTLDSLICERAFSQARVISLCDQMMFSKFNPCLGLKRLERWQCRSPSLWWQDERCGNQTLYLQFTLYLDFCYCLCCSFQRQTWREKVFFFENALILRWQRDILLWNICEFEKKVSVCSILGKNCRDWLFTRSPFRCSQHELKGKFERKWSVSNFEQLSCHCLFESEDFVPVSQLLCNDEHSRLRYPRLTRLKFPCLSCSATMSTPVFDIQDWLAWSLSSLLLQIHSFLQRQSIFVSDIYSFHESVFTSCCSKDYFLDREWH